MSPDGVRVCAYARSVDGTLTVASLCDTVEHLARAALEDSPCDPRFALQASTDVVKGPPPMPLAARVCVFFTTLRGGLQSGMAGAIHRLCPERESSPIGDAELSYPDWCVVADHIFTSARPHGPIVVPSPSAELSAAIQGTFADTRHGGAFHVAFGDAAMSRTRQQVLKLLFDAVDVESRCVGAWTWAHVYGVLTL